MALFPAAERSPFLLGADEERTLTVAPSFAALHAAPPAWARSDTGKVRLQGPLFYFEVTFRDPAPTLPAVSIGFCGAHADLFGNHIAPGMASDTWVLHCRTRAPRNNQQQGKPFPAFPDASRQTMGVGFNAVDHSIFATHNGVLLGTLFRDIPMVPSLRACLAFEELATVEIREIGDRELLFDTAAMQTQIAADARLRISGTPLPSAHRALLHQHIIDYLLFRGASEAASLLATATGVSATLVPLEPEIDAARLKVEALCEQDMYGPARVLLLRTFPTFTESHPELDFELGVEEFASLAASVDVSDAPSLARLLQLGRDLSSRALSGPPMAAEHVALLTDAATLLALPAFRRGDHQTRKRDLLARLRMAMAALAGYPQRPALLSLAETVSRVVCKEARIHGGPLLFAPDLF